MFYVGDIIEVHLVSEYEMGFILDINKQIDTVTVLLKEGTFTTNKKYIKEYNRNKKQLFEFFVKSFNVDVFYIKTIEKLELKDLKLFIKKYIEKQNF